MLLVLGGRGCKLEGSEGQLPYRLRIVLVVRCRGRHRIPNARHVPELRERALIVDGVSKSFAMTGWRIGWAAGPKPWIDGMARWQSHATSGATSISQWASLAALRAPAEERRRRCRVFRERRDRMLASLDRHFPDGVTWTRPEGGLFLWARLPEGFDSGELLAGVRRRGVLFSPGTLFHVEGRGANTMRLTYASVPPDRIDDGIEVLGSWIRTRWSDIGRSASDSLTETVPVL